MPGYGYIRERKAPERPSAKPQITSFADVTLVLLVIFLVSASAAMQLAEVELPQAVHASARDINLAVTISLSDQPPVAKEGDGTAAKGEPKPAPTPKPAAKGEPKTAPTKKDPWLFYFEDDTTGIEAKNLWTVLKETKRIPGTNEYRHWPLALVRADKDAPCEHVSILIQCLQSLGVDEIAFVIATEETKKEDDDEE